MIKITLLLFLVIVIAVIESDAENITVAPQKVETQTPKHSRIKLPKGSKKPKPKVDKPVVRPQNKFQIKAITPKQVQTWADTISEQFYETEKQRVQRDFLLKGFSNYKVQDRNGSAIVDEMARKFEELLNNRTEAAWKIMRAAESIAQKNFTPTTSYQYDSSVDLDILKPMQKKEEYDFDNNCTNFGMLHLDSSMHFDARVTLDSTSVHVSPEVFGCDYRVLPHIYWSEQLLSTFRDNYAQDATTAFQYFCSAKGFLRHYPAALWSSMFKMPVDGVDDVYDCRLRPWYVGAGGAPRDVLVLLDASGSMNNSTNKVIAEMFTQVLLTTLTDDDQVNVLRFNVEVESPITCFNDKMVAANHVNAAAMMAAIQGYRVRNETHMHVVLERAVRLLQKQKADPTTTVACQQAIVLLTDSLYGNYSDLMRHLDPTGEIRLFVFWLHDPYGLRDNSREVGSWISCDRDGVFAELITSSDVTEQVMRMLRVMERPFVHQRKERLTVFSDVYAHVEHPRRSEFYWQQKENAEQKFRYMELRKDRAALLSSARRLQDHLNHESLNTKGRYYEGEDINYRLQISVSVPVFDSTTSENITIRLMPMDMKMKSTRKYPVDRLLGVAGVDIPIDHLKLVLPYHELGAGGSLFIVDHRGNVVLHDNLKPLFDGDILKPGYRTVDMIDLEQPAVDHLARHYPREWLEFRKEVIIDKPRGNRTLRGKHIFEDGMRMYLEAREYHWRRILDHYTTVVVLPKYNRKKLVADAEFTQKLAADAMRTLHENAEFSVHPDWLYCRHVDQHFTNREREFGHFLRRRTDEPDFKPYRLKHVFSPIPPALLDKTYQCDMQLMAQVSQDAVATAEWAKLLEDRTDKKYDCLECKLGSITSFFASENGLTRWQEYSTTSGHADPPRGEVWSRGVLEAWYRRAARAPGILVHAPLQPNARLRNSDRSVPSGGVRATWFTAARWAGAGAGAPGAGVAGFHFFPKHLEEFVEGVVNYQKSCEDDEPDCEVLCNGEDWSCYLIDEFGWILSTESPSQEEFQPIRKHLATTNPLAMTALLNASIFSLHWVHDYQAVCFQRQPRKAAAVRIVSMLKFVWTSVSMIGVAIQQLFTVLSNIGRAWCDTEFEKEKRRNRTRKDYERERYETLYDDAVFVNRTRYAACDRSRPMYELQRTEAAMSKLSRPADGCSWPLVGAAVKGTNLVLLAVYNACPAPLRPLPDPMDNLPVSMYEEDTPPASNSTMSEAEAAASRLACWRHRVPLPGRLPRAHCFPHQYNQEKGYRQCGPWQPDPDTVED